MISMVNVGPFQFPRELNPNQEPKQSEKRGQNMILFVYNFKSYMLLTVRIFGEILNLWSKSLKIFSYSISSHPLDNVCNILINCSKCMASIHSIGISKFFLLSWSWSSSLCIARQLVKWLNEYFTRKSVLLRQVRRLHKMAKLFNFGTSFKYCFRTTDLKKQVKI